MVEGPVTTFGLAGGKDHIDDQAGGTASEHGCCQQHGGFIHTPGDKLQYLDRGY
jgi:hypothetical protein